MSRRSIDKMSGHRNNVICMPDREGEPPDAGECLRESRETAFLIHELRRHNAELLRQNQQLRLEQLMLIEAWDSHGEPFARASFVALTLDGAGRLVDLDLAAAIMLGAPRAQLLGRDLASWMPPADALRFRANACRRLVASVGQVCRVRLRQGARLIAGVRLRSTAVWSDAELGSRASLIVEVASRRLS